MIDVEEVRQWLVKATDAELDELDEWIEWLECGDGPLEVDVADIDNMWDRVVALAGGVAHPQLLSSMCEFFGQVTQFIDFLPSDEGDDVADAIHVDFRSHLLNTGRAPGGWWAAQLRFDVVRNAVTSWQTWVDLDPGAAEAQLRSTLESCRESCTAQAASTLSTAMRRLLTTTDAWCSHHLGDHDRAIEAAEAFFVLHRQAARESGVGVGYGELLAVTVAGAGSYAARRDAEGVAEVMRRVRGLAEPAGGTMQPAFIAAWASITLDLDPEFSQMLSIQLLRDVQAEQGEHSDDAFAAAHQLLIASTIVNDVELLGSLVNEWVPLALNAEPGPGVQLWLESLELEEPDESPDDY